MGPWGRALEEGSGARGGQLCLGKHCPHCPLLHPSYAYIEFATESSAQAAVELDKSIFRGRVIKVCHCKARGWGWGEWQGHTAAPAWPFASLWCLGTSAGLQGEASFLTQTSPAGGDAGLTEAVAGLLWPKWGSWDDWDQARV